MSWASDRDDYVLLVEDDDDIGMVASAILREELDLVVVWVQSGNEAIEQVRRSPPRLILLDLSLPGLDGLEVCRRLKAEPATGGIPVIAVTALSPIGQVRASALAAGCDDWLAKPFALDALIEVTRRWLAHA